MTSSKVSGALVSPRTKQAATCQTEHESCRFGNDMRGVDLNETKCRCIRRTGRGTGGNQAGIPLGVRVIERDYLRLDRHRFADPPGPQAKHVADCVELKQDILRDWIERDDPSSQKDRYCGAVKPGDHHSSVRPNLTRVADERLRPSYGQGGPNVPR